jgi:hypothetical protein
MLHFMPYQKPDESWLQINSSLWMLLRRNCEVLLLVIWMMNFLGAGTSTSHIKSAGDAVCIELRLVFGCGES